MAYEWNTGKTRRSDLIRLGSVLLATLVTVGLPVFIFAEALSR